MPPMVGTPVIGVSLLTWCAMHFRIEKGGEKHVQHSIPKMKEPRYSIAMRTIITVR